MTEIIDPNQVYISYQGDNQGVVDKLCGLLREKGIAYCTFQEERGKIGRIHDFEKKIGRARMKVIFYSNKYFESHHCMNEYAEIREHEDCDQYVRMVNCGNVKFTRDFVMDLEKKWGNKEVDLKYKVGKLKNEENAARVHRFYKEESDKYCIQKLENYFRGDPNYENCSDSDLEKLASDIKAYIDSHPVVSQDNGLPTLNFATRRKDLIVPRVTEAQKIKKLFETEAIVNMVGWGGCGKSTISEYFVIENKGYFSQITGITINNDFYEDICTKYTEILNVPYEHIKVRNEFADERQEKQIDYEATYHKILSKLDEYPIKGGKYNLIIFDVNETVGVSGYVRITDAISKMEDRENPQLKNWKVLVIAREKLVKRSRIFDLVEADKIEFNVLKGIFFKYLEPSKHQYYKEPIFKEDDLKQLFDRLDNCALLVEQLARYLDRDAMTYEKIVNHLEIGEGTTLTSYMSSFDLSSMTDQEKRNKKVGFFLHRLISYAELDGINDDDIQKRIVRLFTVWERVYYSADVVIYFLVDQSAVDKRTIKREEDAVRFALGRLVDKRIFDTMEEEGKAKYQIHSLIAESCRRQIFANPKFSDFSDYMAKIDSYNGKDDTLMKSCIIYSLANYVSFDEKYLLKKAHKYEEKSIYERALKIKYLKIKTANQISEKEIYSMFEESNFKNTYADELYYSWLYKESGYSSVLDCHKPLSDKPYVAKMIQDMVQIDDGTRGCVFIRPKNKGFFNKIKSLFKSGNDDEPVKREVKGFCICKYQVTQGLWYEVMHENLSYFQKGGDYPVENVSWYDCLAFIMELNQITGMTFGFPTEKQWEYAASCGGKYKYAGTNNEDELEDYAWYIKNSGRETHRVGTTKFSNDFGLYDMSGNVWEWCQDWLSSGWSRVLRGGSWGNSASYCRVSYRDGSYPVNRNLIYGLRLALVVP